MTAWIRTLLLPLCLLLAGPCAAADDASPDARRKAFDGLLAEHWEEVLRMAPEFATLLGDSRYDDRWSDGSLAGAEARRRATEAWIARFEAVDTRGFPEAERLNRTLMLDQLRDTLESQRLGLHLMPLDPTGGAHLNYPQFAAVVPTGTVADFEHWQARLEAMPEQVDQLIEVARAGLRAGLMPPRFLLATVAAQCDAIAAAAGADSPFAQPLAKMPATLPAAEQARLRAAILAAIDGRVRPAYRRLARFVERDYAPKGRTEPGLWSLPGGAALYRYLIRSQTTTDLDPESIHQLGLAEVARIEAEQAAIARQFGYDDLASFRTALRQDPDTFARSPEQILERYRAYNAQMAPMLPTLFGRLPEMPVEVRAVEAYAEKEAPSASYLQGSADGTRPGQIHVNTGDYRHRTLLSIEATAYHEGSPGHHLQISIAQRLPELPAFRQQGHYTAYVEGWALYAERLGKEVGFYQDPLSDYGRLSDELLRANRLVLDTGVHHRRWTRQQMVDWFHAHSSEDEPTVQSETDRYIVWPGQALAYKLGQLRILALRAEATAALGPKFDLRAFHDTVLGGGALPLDVLAERVRAWIARVQAGG